MKLFGIGCRRVSSRGFRDQAGKGGGGERCSHNLQSDRHMHAGQRYLQAANDLRCYSWCVFYFRWRVWRKHQSKLYWAWRLVSVWENVPKLKDTTVNHFALRREFDITGRLKSIYVRTVSQRNNTPEPYGLLLYLLFQSPGMTAFPNVFP